MLCWLSHTSGGKTRGKQHGQVSKKSNENTGILQTQHTAHAPHTMPACKEEASEVWGEEPPKEKVQSQHFTVIFSPALAKAAKPPFLLILL